MYEGVWYSQLTRRPSFCLPQWGHYRHNLRALQQGDLDVLASGVPQLGRRSTLVSKHIAYSSPAWFDSIGLVRRARKEEDPAVPWGIALFVR